MKNFSQLLKLRFRNYGFCVSFFALIPIVCQTIGIEIPLGDFEAMTNAILTFLVAAGLVSNPTTQSRWYNDDPDTCQCKRCASERNSSERN